MKTAGNRRLLSIAIALTCASLVLSTGCELPPFAQFDEQPEDPQFVEDFELDGNPEAGESIFAARCASCHGESGQGDGPAGVGMQPPPTNFTQVPLDPQRAYLVTREGGRAMGLSAGMPAFRAALEEQELRDVTAYAMAFYDDEPQEQPDEQPEPEPAAEAESAAEVESGPEAESVSEVEESEE